MHFPLIRLEEIDRPVEDWDVNVDYDDARILEHTDYCGEIYSEEERKRVINSEWLSELFDGIATLDKEKETITFLNPDTIETTLSNYYIHLTSDLHIEALKKKVKAYNLYSAANYYKDCWSLFNIGEWWQTSMDFMDDAHWHAGETWRIGNIFDAHI